jgi:hypothetical protein
VDAIQQAYKIDANTLVLEYYGFTTNAATVDVRSSGKQHFSMLDDCVLKHKLGKNAPTAIHQLSIDFDSSWVP